MRCGWRRWRRRRGRRSARSRALAESSVRVVIVAGEPGGSIAATRGRIEQRWGARVIDHYGLTEVGPIASSAGRIPGFLHLNEAEYLCEVIDPATGEAVADGQMGELVVTNLGRTASPVIRYRTGDIVVRRPARAAAAARSRVSKAACSRAPMTWSTCAA